MFKSKIYTGTILISSQCDDPHLTLKPHLYMLSFLTNNKIYFKIYRKIA